MRHYVIDFYFASFSFSGKPRFKAPARQPPEHLFTFEEPAMPNKFDYLKAASLAAVLICILF